MLRKAPVPFMISVQVRVAIPKRSIRVQGSVISSLKVKKEKTGGEETLGRTQ